jgi:ubiquinone/menaquinone biosynthesis C-methylase UbiE
MKSLDARAQAYYQRTAPFYDLMLGLTARLDGVNPRSERGRLVESLGLHPADRVLEVGIGTGDNLKFFQRGLDGQGLIAGADLTHAMLRCCQRRHRRSGPLLVQANAAQLPFAANRFDAVLHFGGISSYAEPEGTIRAMMRVARPGATIIISDKSLPPDRPRTPRQRLILAFNPHLAAPPPLDLLPLCRSEVDLDWFWSGMIYRLKFLNP